MINKKILFTFLIFSFCSLSQQKIAFAEQTCDQNSGSAKASASVCVGDCPAGEHFCWPVNTVDEWTQLPFCGGDSSCYTHKNLDAIDVGGGTQKIYAPVAGTYTYYSEENNSDNNNGNKGCAASVSFQFKGQTYQLLFIHMPYSNGAGSDASDGVCKTGSVTLKVGDVIGVTNSTGDSTGTHLHLQVAGNRSISNSILAQVFFNGVMPLSSNKSALTDAIKDNLCSQYSGGNSSTCTPLDLTYDSSKTWEACVNNRVSSPALGLTDMVPPIKGLKTTGLRSNFGYNGGDRNHICHVGQDLYPTAKDGTANIIQAMASGTIIKKTSGWGDSDTCGVDILHTAADGIQYVFRYGEYANCDELTYSNLQVNQTVSAGTPLGILQKSGHLHLEMHVYTNSGKYFGSGWKTISCETSIDWCAKNPRDTIMCTSQAPATAEFIRDPWSVIQETLN